MFSSAKNPRIRTGIKINVSIAILESHETLSLIQVISIVLQTTRSIKGYPVLAVVVK